MKSLRTAISLALAGTLFAGCGGHTTAPIPTAGTFNTQSSSIAAQPFSAGVSIEHIQHLTPLYLTLPAKIDRTALEAQRTAGTTLPFWSGTIKSPLDGNTYGFDIAGADPHTSTTTTDISVVPIVLKIKFPDGHIFDPTKPGCNDTVSVEKRFYSGPDFVGAPLTSNGVSEGTTQLGDADMRAEFYMLDKTTGYHVKLLKVKAPVVITVSFSAGAAEASITCNGNPTVLGAVEINTFDAKLQALAKTHSTSNEVPLFLTYNFVQYIGTTSNCCVLGYHSAFTNVGTEAYATAGYVDAGIFSGAQDISAWSHEIGELLNDPFGNNATPAWGHIGQVSGCQSNLEVGDPLSGTTFTVTLGGFTYHPQDLAFFDWFFRTPSQGTGGKYSFRGTLTASQPAVCT